MKKTILTFAVLIIATASVFAQDDKDKKNISKETVIVEKIIDDGHTKKVITTEKVKQEKQVITIHKNDAENQNEAYSTKRKEVIAENEKVEPNTKNKSEVNEIKRNEKKELETSKEKQKEKMKAEKIELEQKAADDAKRKKDSIHKKYAKENKKN